ncbi:putative ABC transporter ATP-binding protein YlmA [BD1-7 clade bacterium]|uniref:Putative ABC transporter ATP-binding protein YlmA n=1 Tax=BD1-7 clade bacterium TaxID=2029982 RepID=A0A5S9PIK7_9GAMM|nr:putative ABC transporter ATP-binding protein YlmA [BD1-7 clade bacterium]CAA0103610.1 putative ABC transporter ATP-binding protein YlmA [BD1-7 clade bacterium]
MKKVLSKPSPLSNESWIASFVRDCKKRLDFQELLDSQERLNTQEQGSHVLVVGGTESNRNVLIESLLIALQSQQKVAEIGPLTQTFLIEQEAERDDSDLTDEVFAGTPLGELLREVSADDTAVLKLADQLGLTHRLQVGFRKLSSGETRKALIARALLSQPSVLLANEPLQGLDTQTRQVVVDLLNGFCANGMLIMATDRFDVLPDSLTHLLSLKDHELEYVDLLAQPDRLASLRSIHHLQNQSIRLPDLPDTLSHIAPPALDHDLPLVRMCDIHLGYQGAVLISGLNWTVMPGQHWQIKGRNGSGKTSLLKLITGDNSQCYTNDIHVFGYRRGSGESIWDIKRYIGLVSSDLQWAYRVAGTVLEVVVSGLYESIGLYRQSDSLEQQLAMQWLDVLGVQHLHRISFQQLSFGDQRLVLIARAMIKQPALLILDEPCQGLDAVNRQRVIALVEKLLDQTDVTLLYVTHYADETVRQVEHTLELGSWSFMTAVLSILD